MNITYKHALVQLSWTNNIELHSSVKHFYHTPPQLALNREQVLLGTLDEGCHQCSL